MSATDESFADAPLGSLLVEAQCKLKASMSMVFTDVLSQELTSALTSPYALSVIQSYLKNTPDAVNANPVANPAQLAPIMDQVPESVLDLVKEAVFCSGALVRNVGCMAELKVGDALSYNGQAELLEMTILDGRVASIGTLLKPQRLV